MKSNTYQFRYVSAQDEACADMFPVQTEIISTHQFDDSATWDIIVKQFCQFLSGIYGYDISDKIQYETLEDKLQRLRDRGVIQDDPEAWDDEWVGDDEEPCEHCGK